MDEFVFWSRYLKSLRQFWQLLKISGGALIWVILAVCGQGSIELEPGVTHLVSIVGEIVAVCIIGLSLLICSDVSPQVGGIEEVCIVLSCVEVGLVELISIVLCGHSSGRRRGEELGGYRPG